MTGEQKPDRASFRPKKCENDDIKSHFGVVCSWLLLRLAGKENTSAVSALVGDS